MSRTQIPAPKKNNLRLKHGMERNSTGLKRTDKILLQLLRSGLEGLPIAEAAELSLLDAGAWKRMLRMSAAQGVLAVTYDAIRKMPDRVQPPKELVLAWAVNTDRIEQDFARKSKVLEELAAFYGSHGICTMLLKGSGLASLYPVPAHRPCGDIDIWLHGRQAEADEIMRQELKIPISNDVHHHTIFFFKGVMVENHFDFLNLWSHRSNRRLEQQLRRFAAEKGAIFNAGMQEIALPSPNFNALFLMRHMAVHFAAVEICLRHIADWAVFLRADGNQVNWPEVRAIYREQNMNRFADAITALCVKQLGIKPAMAYAYEDDADLQAVILKEILHPAFSEKHPESGLLAPALFKLRRWWANRWKHRLVYKDSLAGSFLWLCWAHVIRPKSIIQ